MPSTMGTHDDEARSARSKCSQQNETVEEAMLSRVHHPFLLWERCNQAAKSRYNSRINQLLPIHIYSPCVVDWNVFNRIGCGEVIDEMLKIKLCVAGTDEEIFTSKAWTRVFNIEEPIYSKLYHEFYSTYEFDKFCVDDELRTKNITKFKLCGRAFSWTLLEFAKRLTLYHSKEIEDEGFDACSFMLCDLDFEPLTLSLSSMPSCDLVSLANILILCLILKASNQSLQKSLSLNLKLS
ncbi:hypothetical protein Tco_0127276 [Tanacetum coccineum]